MTKRNAAIPPQPPVNQPKADVARDRIPAPPDMNKVEGLVTAMGMAAGQFCQMNNAGMAELLSACFTLAHRSIDAVLYHTDPPLNVREQFRMRGVVVGGIEKLWNFAAGGGGNSKFDKH